MSSFALPKTPEIDFVAVAKGATLKAMLQSGRLPPIKLKIQPLNPAPLPNLFKEPIFAKFLTYQFSSSIIVPVDTFSFTLALDEIGVGQIPVQDGDIARLEANGQTLATGIIDSVDVETDATQGTRITINGRDLLSQFEDQDAVNIDAVPIYGKEMTVSQVVSALKANTRLQGPNLKLAPSKGYLFATQPGESKLSAFQRYCEGLNIIFWMNPDGSLNVGKPNFNQASKGRLFISRKERDSNVLSMRVTKAATAVPNMIAAIWNGQEEVQARIGKEQVFKNAAPGPKRLLSYGHRVPRAVVVSTPDGSKPQDLSAINTINRAGGANILQAYAKREIARENMKELQVQCLVFGHYNENGEPYAPDQVYKIEYDIAGIDEELYLYAVEYGFGEDGGQRTNLFFCRKFYTIVADNKVFE